MERRLTIGNIDVLTLTTVDLIEKGLLLPRIMLACGWNLAYLEVDGI